MPAPAGAGAASWSWLVDYLRQAGSVTPERGAWAALRVAFQRLPNNGRVPRTSVPRERKAGRRSAQAAAFVAKLAPVLAREGVSHAEERSDVIFSILHDATGALRVPRVDVLNKAVEEAVEVIEEDKADRGDAALDLDDDLASDAMADAIGGATS